ncbi:MAG: hypothetical protein NZT92_16140 [Abditibacteriales bacterium]|nr:hypothetical protein [Abditibacteriales bacterium]MDW8367448.1 SpoIVB peptidase S55 domain-containing protein [Abditibacteriales bacterium]
MRNLFVVSVMLLSVGVSSARGQTLDVNRLLREGKIMRASDAKRGMIGVGKSVFQGTKIEEFKVAILGTLEKVDNGGDIVMIKVLNGPIIQRQSGVIQGMSGSPIYVNGKLLGAVAYAMGMFPREPICGVKPIIEMIETTNAKPKAPPRKLPLPVALAEPLRIGERTFRRVIVGDAPSSPPKDKNTLILKPAQTLMLVNGISERSLPLWNKLLGRYGIKAVMGPGKASVKANPTLEPGAAVGVQLVSGDIDISSIGTVTFREGNRVLAFGHPMFSLGSVNMPMTTAYIHDIFPSQEISFKMGAPLKTVGNLVTDGVHGIAGTIGGKPDMVPMLIKVRDEDNGWSKSFSVQVINDKVLLPQLAVLAANDAIGAIFGNQSEVTVRLNLAVDAEGIKPIRRSNIRFASGVATRVALVDLMDAISFVTDPEFGRPRLKKVFLEATLEHTQRTARIKRIFANRVKVKPGEELEVGVVMEPYPYGDGKTVTETFKFTIPKITPGGTLRIGAGPGGVMELLLRSRLGVRMPQPTNLAELLEFYEGVHANNDLVVKVALPSMGVSVANRPVPDLPSSALQLMFLSRSSDLQVFREDMTQTKRTEWYITGMQFLNVQVDSPRKALSPPLPPPGATSPASGGSGSPPSGGGTPSSTEDYDFETASFSALTGDDWETFPTNRLLKLNRQFLRRHSREAGWAGGDTPSGGEEGERTPLQTRSGEGGGSGRPSFPNFPPSSGGEGLAGTPPPTPGQGVARPSRSIVHKSVADFLTGTFEGTCVTSKGDVRLGPKGKVYFAWQEPYFWSVAVDAQNNLYVGSGNDGKIFKIARDGQSNVVYDAKDIAIYALAFDSKGNLYAGGTPTGRVYKITPDGRASVFVETARPTIWSLAVDNNDNLYIGTGGASGKGGVIYRAATTTARPTLETLVSFPPDRALDHVRCLAVDASGNVYAGTGDEGVLYQIAPDGKMKALYHTPDGEILSVAVDGRRGVYFGTSGKGTIYRWLHGQERVEEIYPSPQSAVYALAVDPAGNVYAATGNTAPLGSALGGIVYRITPDKVASRLLEPDQSQTLSIALSQDNKLFAATANNAVVYEVDLSYNLTGTYESAVFDMKVTTQWGTIRWSAEEPSGTRVWLETRSGNTKEPDASWSDWVAYSDPSGSKIQSPPGRFIQYRARFHAPSGGPTPVLSRVEIVCRPQNQPPTVKFEAFRTEQWRGKQMVQWQASDPDGDKLSYHLFLVGADGIKELEQKPIASRNYELDTTKLKDGTYRLRILATDRISNPEGPLTAEDESAAVTIDNTPPQVQIEVKADENDPFSLKLRITCTDQLSPVMSAEYHVDGDDWKALPAQDGIFDSPQETIVFGLRFRDLKDHTIEVQVRDAAGNVGKASYHFKSPNAVKEEPKTGAAGEKKTPEPSGLHT